MSDVPEIAPQASNGISIKEELECSATSFLKEIFGSEIKQNMRASAKCGEVHIGFTGNFTFICAVCGTQFLNLESFGAHIQKVHLKLNMPDEFNEKGGCVADSIQDPLIDCCAEENAAIKRELEDLFRREEFRESPINNIEKESNENKEKISHETENIAMKVKNNLKFVCKQCGLKYTHRRSYLAHARKAHGILTTQMRNKIIRGAKIEEKYSLENKSEFTCFACNRSYKHQRSLRFHVRSFHGPSALRLLPLVLTENLEPLDSNYDDNDCTYSKPNYNYCNNCNRTYRYKRNLLFHIKNEHGDDTPLPITENNICKYCDKNFNKMDLLKTHIEEEHSGYRKFMCPHCPKSFNCTTTRQEHINTHTGEKPFKCPQCSRSFSNSSNLKAHIRLHLQIKKHCCKFCGKRFVSSSENRRHERTHTGEKLYQCEECGKQYPTRNKLNHHLRRHKNIKNYTCEVCNKTFYDLTKLKDHMLVHTQERPFNCEVCGHTFPRKRALRVHEQLHSDVKKYVCPTCGKAFAQCAGLYSHRKSHERIK